MAKKSLSELYPSASKIIRKYESVKQSGNPHLEPYYDELGKKWTVGFGRTLRDDQIKGLSEAEIKKKYRMTAERAEADIDKQIQTSLEGIEYLKTQLPEGVSLNKGEIESLIPLIQNAGLGNIKELNSGKPTKAITALREGNKKKFMYELFDPNEGIVSAGGAKQLGLQRRRLEEGSIAKVYEGGEFNRKSGGRIMNQTQLNYNKQRFI
jgi:GH24 family phage-related lysozyme (muramidase)